MGQSTETTHSIHVSDARSMDALEDDSVELVITSPPYPMIEMWDDVFAELNTEINECLSSANSQDAFHLMHDELAQVWQEVRRVLAPGGIACINIGDATRKHGDTFQVFPNHAEVISRFSALGFTELPSILWRKPTNKSSKFMGSGMLPPNAYTTQEHEYILVFRNGSNPRSFESKSQRRYESAYFWEERNQWYSDTWSNIPGTDQTLDNEDARKRSAAFPFRIPYRLINMYSVYGDTVLDPFWGTGTTSLAAMAAARHSVGYELEEELAQTFDNRVQNIEKRTDQLLQQRLQQHREFVTSTDHSPSYTAEHYNTSVMTQQEQQIRFRRIDSVNQSADHNYTVTHEPYKEKKKEAAERRTLESQ